MKTHFVAELSINHFGMVKIAKQMILEAKNAGANSIKLKLKNVDKYYEDDNKKWRNFSFKTYRSSLELSKSDFLEIDKFCKDIDIDWFATVHDKESLDFISSFNPQFYKVASMDAARENFVNDVMDLCYSDNKPLIISIGGKTDEFTRKIINKITERKICAFLLHTVSIYPTPIGKNNINYILHLKEMYENEKIKIGYSGHEVGYAPSILAASHGAWMIERHFALSRNVHIHHINAALEPEEYGQMVKTINEFLIEKNAKANDFETEELNFLERKEYK